MNPRLNLKVSTVTPLDHTPSPEMKKNQWKPWSGSYLYHKYPEIAQGYLTLLRKANVNTENFARVAVRHKLDTYLRCTAPDVDDQVRKFIEVVDREDQEKTLVYQEYMKAPKVLADIVASVAAAIYV
ncbi:hypothetical protein M0R45_015329 [Rubus argutus]|uniref:RNase III domain-containing protein n=1 Tax=Rubus argutus TaxID=59490 RepID=A0AAW1XQC7_RUBAR